MNTVQSQVDALCVIEDSMSIYEIPKNPIGLSVGMKPLGQSHSPPPPPPPYCSISTCVLNWNLEIFTLEIIITDYNHLINGLNKLNKHLKSLSYQVSIIEV